jgi:hypothetical protein
MLLGNWQKLNKWNKKYVSMSISGPWNLPSCVENAYSQVWPNSFFLSSKSQYYSLNARCRQRGVKQPGETWALFFKLVVHRYLCEVSTVNVRYTGEETGKLTKQWEMCRKCYWTRYGSYLVQKTFSLTFQGHGSTLLCMFMSTHKFQCPSQCSGAQATLGQRFHLTDKSLYFLRQGRMRC